jgi:hypothetical protein
VNDQAGHGCFGRIEHTGQKQSLTGKESARNRGILRWTSANRLYAQANLRDSPRTKDRSKMARTRRIFISFAIEDVRYRDLLVGQARSHHTPFQFVDMSAKRAWDSMWKTNCRLRIRGCDGVIALISKNTRHAAGQLWEVACAKQEGVPVVALYIFRDDRPLALPVEFVGVPRRIWTWENIKAFTRTL